MWKWNEVVKSSKLDCYVRDHGVRGQIIGGTDLGPQRAKEETVIELERQVQDQPIKEDIEVHNEDLKKVA